MTPSEKAAGLIEIQRLAKLCDEKAKAVAEGLRLLAEIKAEGTSFYLRVSTLEEIVNAQNEFIKVFSACVQATITQKDALFKEQVSLLNNLLISVGKS